MAKAVADVNTELQGGFASDDGESEAPLTVEAYKILTSYAAVTGFSHMHDSGTGGVSYLSRSGSSITPAV